MANEWRTLYIGVTINLEKRVYEHKNKVTNGFTKKYGINKLVYFEVAGETMAAIEREKQLKGWLRKRKIALIESINPTWKDLSDDWTEQKLI